MMSFCIWHKKYFLKNWILRLLEPILSFKGFKKPYLRFEKTHGLCAKCAQYQIREIDNIKIIKLTDEQLKAYKPFAILSKLK